MDKVIERSKLNKLSDDSKVGWNARDTNQKDNIWMPEFSEHINFIAKLL